jgi:hypothetical protein
MTIAFENGHVSSPHSRNDVTPANPINGTNSAHGERSHQHEASGFNISDGLARPVLSDVAHACPLPPNYRLKSQKWHVSNSVQLPAHVTEREVIVLAMILGKKFTTQSPKE